MIIYEKKLKFVRKSLFAGAIIVGFIGAFLIYGNLASAVDSASTNWSWIGDIANVYSSNEIPAVNYGNCDGVLQSIGVYPLLENKMACIKNNGTIRIGYYFDNNFTRYVISYPLDDVFYQLEFPCSYPTECLYMPGSDSLATKQYLVNGYVKSLVIYKNVSKRIKLTPASTLKFKYTFDISNPDYTFKSSSGYAWPIGGFGASDNGLWLAVELRERGVGLLDMQTMEMKRLSSEYLRYGYGYNPTTELAVSNSGKQVVQMGFNAGISFYDLSKNCGVIADDNTTWMDYVEKPCKKVAINFESFIHRFFSGHNPRFSNDGAELSFFADSYSENPREVVLRAKSFTSQRLDYLAMGDSFTSGEGESDDRYYEKGTNTEFEKCHVSNRSYPFKIAVSSNLDGQFVKSVACSGARTNDVIGDSKKYLGQGSRLGTKGLNLSTSELALAQSYAKYNFFQGRIHQKIFVDQYKPGIITIGIGGNDVGLVQKLQSCIGVGVCEEATSHARKKQVAAEINRLYSKLVQTYSSLLEDSPDSKIFVIGYPRVVSETGSCGLVLGKLLNAEERKFFNESIKYLNQVIESAAKTVGVKYVDNYNSFGEGVICGSDKEKAINDFRIGDDIGINEKFKWTRIIGSESFHPNPNGFSLIADNFMSKIGNINTAKVCLSGQNLCPVNTPAPEPPAYWGGSEDNDLPMLVSTDFVENKDISSGSRFRNLQLESYSLQPNSLLEVSVYSEKSVIGEFSSDENGSLIQQIELPQDLDYGFHTIHIVGKSYSGQDIELYQSINYFDDTPVPVVVKDDDFSPVVNENNEVAISTDGLDSEQISTDSDAIYNEDILGVSVDQSIAPLPTVKGAVDINPKHKSAESAKEGEDYTIFIGVVVVSIFTFGFGLLIIRSRNKA